MTPRGRLGEGSKRGFGVLDFFQKIQNLPSSGSRRFTNEPAFSERRMSSANWVLSTKTWDPYTALKTQNPKPRRAIEHPALAKDFCRQK